MAVPFSPSSRVVAALVLAASLSARAELRGDAGVPEASPRALVFFWGVGCPRCEEARPFIDALEAEVSQLRIERIEVRENPEGRRRFFDTMRRLGAEAVGVPTFVAGDGYVVGYSAGATEREVRELLGRAGGAASGRGGEARAGTLALPWLGTVDLGAAPLPALTVALGLVDGVNPCAIWVLIVLLGVLLHVKERRLMVWYAAVFIAVSGVVYFAFMVAWSALFELVGLSRLATMLLGGALLMMGLLNLKELLWFKRGPSLVIPERAKPGLFRRMRQVAGAASLPAAIAGIAALALVVNLIELGCTIGLPAVYTRVLSLRGLSAGARYAYLALYNVAYVVPLFAVALAFVMLRRRLVMSQRVAQVLKGVSGLLLAAFGAVFLLAPQLLVGAGR